MQLPADAPLSDHLTVLFGQMSRAIARQPGLLTRAEYAVVSVLDHTGPRRLGDLAEADGSDPSTVSRRMASLAERGLVERQPDPGDGRAHRVALTERGRGVLDAERRRRAALVTDALSGWPEADRADLTRLLIRLSDSLAQPATSERTRA